MSKKHEKLIHAKPGPVRIAEFIMLVTINLRQQGRNDGDSSSRPWNNVKRTLGIWINMHRNKTNGLHLSNDAKQ